MSQRGLNAFAFFNADPLYIVSGDSEHMSCQVHYIHNVSKNNVLHIFYCCLMNIFLNRRTEVLKYLYRDGIERTVIFFLIRDTIMRYKNLRFVTNLTDQNTGISVTSHIILIIASNANKFI